MKHHVIYYRKFLCMCSRVWYSFVDSYIFVLCRGSAFPATSLAPEEKCLWSAKMRLALCGDFCVSPNVEGAISSGIAAASKFSEMLSSL